MFTRKNQYEINWMKNQLLLSLQSHKKHLIIATQKYLHHIPREKSNYYILT